MKRREKKGKTMKKEIKIDQLRLKTFDIAVIWMRGRELKIRNAQEAVRNAALETGYLFDAESPNADRLRLARELLLSLRGAHGMPESGHKGTNMENVALTVGSIRAAGLMAKWGRSRRGAPVMLIKATPGQIFNYPALRMTEGKPCLPHQSANWYRVDQGMYDRACKEGWVAAFDGCTLLADMFSL
jgi:hypothetical protein